MLFLSKKKAERPEPVNDADFIAKNLIFQAIHKLAFLTLAHCELYVKQNLSFLVNLQESGLFLCIGVLYLIFTIISIDMVNRDQVCRKGNFCKSPFPRAINMP